MLNAQTRTNGRLAHAQFGLDRIAQANQDDVDIGSRRK